MREYSGQLFILHLVVLLAATGCRQIPDDYPREASHAMPPATESTLGGHFYSWLSEEEGRSGFFPLSHGTDALGARLSMIEAAEESIDLQYFLIKPDMAGILFADRLLDAANRGVRIRFLLDDIFTSVTDEQLAYLDAHPNIEVRLFNPLIRGFGRWSSFLFNQGRFNRRMHNKSFTVDGVITIVGGRNIADEYYDIKENKTFMDFDIIGVGQVAADVSACFDLYWNSPLAYPLTLFTQENGELPESNVTPDMENRAMEIYHAAVNSDLLSMLWTEPDTFIPAKSRLVTDPPEKLESWNLEETAVLIQALVGAVQSAKKEVIILTPYFVMRKRGVEFLTELARNGLEIIVITNSLASTNHAYVHGGYAPMRKKLLAAGVQIYEVKADAGVSQIADQLQGLTLHTKMILFDREEVFIGSLNVDPRSADWNSEMGLFVESPLLAGAIAERIIEVLPQYAYALSLDKDGDLRWTYTTGDSVEVADSEPGATFKKKWRAFLARILPVKGQL